MKKITGVLTAAVLLTVVSCGSLRAQSQPAAAPQAAAKPKAATAPKAGTPAKPAVTRSAYDRTLLRPSLLKAQAPATYQVKFTTTRGDFTVTVTRAWAPLGADRFYNLVNHGYYNNASFFRVVPNFIVQFGISAYPPVSAAWLKANINDDPVTQSNKKGYLTFATAGPSTRTTQIFINLKDNAGLARQGFAPFGVVDGDGMKVVNMLYDQYGDSAGPGQDALQKQGKPYLDKGWPKLDSIKSATLVGAAATKPAAPKTAAPPAKNSQ